MGKLILLIIILFMAYWANKYYKKSKTTITIDDNVDAINLPKNATVDMLIDYFEKKVNDIQHKGLKEVKDAEEKLEYYKKELQKLNRLKESLNK